MVKCEIYQTIAAPCEGLYKEKGSKFLAFAFPVASQEEIKAHLEQIKKTYFDARHHCYAYRLGPMGEDFRANDNGEPSSTAGKPILGQLLSFNVSDVLLVVVRYFGGIKLGVGGLINAYREAARDALSHAQIVEKEVRERVTLTYSFAQTSAVMRAVKDAQGTVRDQQYSADGTTCQITVEVLPSRAATLQNALIPQ